MQQQQKTESGSINAEFLIPHSNTEPVLAAPDNQVLEQESLDNFQALIDEFSSEATQRKRKWTILSWLINGGTLPLFGLILFMIPRVPHAYQWLVYAVFALIALIPILLSIPLSLVLRPSERQQKIIDSLIASNDVRAIGPLLSGLATANRGARRLVVTALVSLLPRLQESDAEWLSDANHRSLLSMIKFANSFLMRKSYGDGWTDLVVAILTAIGEIGDSRALPNVEALASGDASTDAGKSIQLAARECLEPLRKRVERDRVGQHLLRSSVEPDCQSDLLVRPTAETPDAHLQELPRPSGLN